MPDYHEVAALEEALSQVPAEWVVTTCSRLHIVDVKPFDSAWHRLPERFRHEVQSRGPHGYDVVCNRCAPNDVDPASSVFALQTRALQDVKRDRPIRVAQCPRCHHVWWYEVRGE